MISRAKILLLYVALTPAALGQAAPDSSGRVSDEGPYRSQVRLLEDRPAETLTDDELLQNLAQDAYGRALVLRQLAQRGIATGDIETATDYFEQALALDSLSPLAIAQMQINLGQLYTLNGRYSEAIELLDAALDSGEFSEPSLIMSLASAYLQNEQPSAAARQAARAIAAADEEAPLEWVEFAVHAHWKAGESADAARWQLRLLNARPDDAGQWQRLAALYRAAGMPASALATLQAAALGGLISDEDEWLRLIQMHIEYGTADIAAQWLRPLVDARPEAQRWHWLGQVLLQSGDEVAALTALTRRAELDDSPQAWLDAGELAASLADPDAAATALRRATRANANGTVRGRALLLLGQVEMELGNIGAARRAFSAASDYGGGVYRTATEWLDFLNRDTAVTLTADATVTPDSTDSSPAPVPEPIAVPELDIKTVSPLRVFTGARATEPAALTSTATELARDLVRASRRDRLEWTGPLHIVFNGDISDPTQTIDVRVAAPVRRAVPPRGDFSSGTLDVFRCVWRRYEGPADGLGQAWRDLITQTLAAGLEPTMEARQIIFHRGDARSDTIVELQIGIL